VLLVLFILIQKRINKTRLDITNFRDEDFKTKLNNVIIDYEKEVESKHPRYYSIMKQKEDIIYSMLNSFSKDNYQNILTEIIMFNESMATK
jgi:hypothetical protein